MPPVTLFRTIRNEEFWLEAKGGKTNESDTGEAPPKLSSVELLTPVVQLQLARKSLMMSGLIIHIAPVVKVLVLVCEAFRTLRLRVVSPLVIVSDGASLYRPNTVRL